MPKLYLLSHLNNFSNYLTKVKTYWEAELAYIVKKAIQWPIIKEDSVQFSSVSQSCPTLRPHGLQHAKLPCPSPTPRAYSNSCPLSWWCHPTISSCCPLLLLPSIFPSIRVFSNESVLPIRWPKYWSFSFKISPSNEYSGLSIQSLGWTSWISLQPKGLSRVFSTPWFKSINSSVLWFYCSLTLTSIHDHWKNHSFDQMGLFWKSNVSDF